MSAAALTLRGLVKAHAPGQPAPSGVTLDVGGSGLTALIGASGTGKSTPLCCINRLIEPGARSA